VAPRLLSCPGCRRLVHADELKSLAAEAEGAEARGDLGAALACWRRADELLPPDSRQHEAVGVRIQALSGRVGTVPESPAEGSGWRKGAAGAGTLGLLGFLLTKGKFLLVGLTKASTFFSMILAFGVYWSLWGWKFAAGLVLSIYIHEMGHVFRLRQYGIKATAPMFIPGLGAFIRLKQYPATPIEDARVGLAGPLWGLWAALGAWLLYLGGDWPVLAAIARFGAWINLFNLIPIWQLDGGRGFRSLTRPQRWIAIAAVGAAWYLTGEAFLALIALGGVVRTFERDVPAKGDGAGLFQYVFLIAALSALLLIKVPGAEPMP
jgi:Zn-dependent protease